MKASTRELRLAWQLSLLAFLVVIAGTFPKNSSAALSSITEERGTAPALNIEGAPSGSTVFLETFTGQPTNPLPWNHRDWDVFQTSRDSRSWGIPDPVNAHHAFNNCGDVALGGSHVVDSWAETVFQCNDHIMTSINGTPGYAAIYLSPPAMADFSASSSTISFDVSTFVSSARDWLDVLITPFAEAMSYPFRSDLVVDGGGLPANAIHIEQDFGSGFWEIELIRNGNVQTLGRLTIPYSQFGGPSRTTRTPVRISISRTAITLSYPTVPGASRTVGFAALGWSQGVVQFGHHSYTPIKDCNHHPELICQPDTWHWDNVRISPSRPFYQWQATPERTGAAIHDSNPRWLSFGKPAPPNASLLFAGNCRVQVRDSGSTTWRAVTIANNNRSPGHTQSYRVSVPTGATSIQFRFLANDWYGLGYGCQLSNPIIKSPLPPIGSNLVTFDQQSGSWAVRNMSGFLFNLRSSGTWSTGYDSVIAGDFDRDGSSDDLLVWSSRAGNWVVQNLVNGTPVYKWGGSWSTIYDEVIAGDFDGDGYFNDLFVWDHDSGNFSVNSMDAFRPTFRYHGNYNTVYDTIIMGDWDGDGRRDDAFIWDTTNGWWVVHSFAAFRPTFRGSGRWAGYERGYAGDWDRDGRQDDLIVWDDDTGNVAILGWLAFKPTYRGSATFSSTIDIATAADLDNDGLWNELFMYDRDGMQWLVYRWYGFVPQHVRAGTWTVGYDIALG